MMQETTQDANPGIITSAVVPQVKELTAESVTAMASTFLKRLGQKGPIKPKRVSLEENLYTVEIELKKFTATIKIDKEARQITEYDVQPKSEESSGSFAPKSLIMNFASSGIVCVGLYFCFKLMGV
ncbi:MAG: hypothetical protein GX638_10615 [Crenarchaeota archaeon]|nr:hypothetical protein [Thermoproteota archaeon]